MSTGTWVGRRRPHGWFRMCGAPGVSDSSPAGLRFFTMLSLGSSGNALAVQPRMACTVSSCLKMQDSQPCPPLPLPRTGECVVVVPSRYRRTPQVVAEFFTPGVTHGLGLPGRLAAGHNPALWRCSVDAAVGVLWIIFRSFPAKLHLPLRTRSAELLQWPLESRPVCPTPGRISLQYAPLLLLSAALNATPVSLFPFVFPSVIFLRFHRLR